MCAYIVHGAHESKSFFPNIGHRKQRFLDCTPLTVRHNFTHAHHHAALLTQEFPKKLPRLTDRRLVILAIEEHIDVLQV